MAYCQEYIDFRDRFCPGMDINDPRVFLRLVEDIDRLKKNLGKKS